MTNMRTKVIRRYDNDNYDRKDNKMIIKLTIRMMMMKIVMKVIIIINIIKMMITIKKW